MRFMTGLVLCWTGLVASVSPAPAADAGQSVVSGFYAAVIRDQGFSSKNVADAKPYLAPALYTLWKDWLSANRDGTGLECGFDVDPIANTQNGAPVQPVTVGAPAMVGGKSYLPVAVSLKFPSGIEKNATHLLAAVVKTESGYAIADLVPVFDGKPYPKTSLYASLVKFKADPKCRM